MNFGFRLSENFHALLHGHVFVYLARIVRMEGLLHEFARKLHTVSMHSERESTRVRTPGIIPGVALLHPFGNRRKDSFALSPLQRSSRSFHVRSAHSTSLRQWKASAYPLAALHSMPRIRISPRKVSRSNQRLER